MRDDMKKVLTERPRGCRRYAYHDFRRDLNRGDYDDLPAHQGMRVPYIRGWGDHKEFSDLLGPLRGYLFKQVGRPWDDVWSEICRAVPSGNTVDEHLKGHARDYVETNTYLGDDGKVHCHSKYGWFREPHWLYVDPVDGTLRAMPEKRAFPKRPPVVVVEGVRYAEEDGILVPVGGWTQRYARTDSTIGRYPIKQVGDRVAILINGVWYWVVFGVVPPPYQGPDGRMIHRYGYDIQTGAQVSRGRYHAGKVQMSSRDLRRYNLRNAV